MPLNDTPLKDFRQEIEKAIGIDREGFMAKRKAMQEKWSLIAKKGEFSKTRIISSILHTRNFVRISILADNLEYFEEHYTEEFSNDNLVKPLVLACLSGSEKIADFLLKKLGKEYTSEDFEFILDYAAASLNVEWAKRIATAMAKQKLPIPREIYSPTNSLGMIIEIRKIFAANNDIQNSPALSFK